MPATTLLPGYKQVDSFGSDEDYEEGEEVSYVTLDLGVVEPTLLPSTSTYRLIVSGNETTRSADDNPKGRKGLDTPTPFLQLSGSIFKGRHDTFLGTELLFTEEKHETQPNKRSLIHVGSTEQRVRFREVQLKRKVEPEPASSERMSPDLHEQVASDVELDAPQAPQSDPPNASPRKKKKSRKGKERAVDVDVMDTT